VKRYGKALLAVVLAIAAVLALTDGPVSSGAQGWWSTAGYTVTNSGFNPNERALTVARVRGLELERTTSPDQAAQSAPVMDKGRVFVYSADAVTAYDEVDGDQLWRHEQPAGEYDNKGGALAVTGNRLVVAWNVGSPPMGGDQWEILDVATGRVLVAPRETPGRVAQLLVDRDVVVISGETRYYDDTVAYRLVDGTELWRSEFAMYQPVSANGRVLVRGWKDNVQYSRILDIRTGKVLVDAPWKYYDVLAADDAGTKFYVAWGHSLQAVDATTGKSTWLASEVYAKYAAVSPTRLYVATAKNKLVAFDAGTGRKFWTKTYAKQLERPIVAGGVLYQTVPGDRMYALDPVDGAALATPPFTGVTTPPVVTNDKLYVTDGVKMSVYGL